MIITTALKNWLTDNCDVKTDATDDEYKTAAADALVNGKLSADKYAELIADPEEKEANEFSQKLDTLTDAITKLAEAQVKQLEKKEDPEKKTEPEAKKEDPEKKDVPPSEMAKMVAQAGCMGATDGKGIDVRVKEAAEQYSTETKGMIYGEKTALGHPHAMAGMPVLNVDGNQIDHPSDRSAAVSGAYWKFLCSSARIGSRRSGFQSLNSHDQELMLYAMDKMKWAGTNDGNDSYENIQNRKLTGNEKQALIDDAISGGTQAVPIVFDDDIISTPLLYGELFPKVKLVTLGRVGLQGVEGVLTLTPIAGWGGVDNAAIAIFNTAIYVQAFNTNVYRWESAIQIGLDFLSDTTIDFGRHITQQYGEVLLRDLDNVIATGNGTTQPQGVMNAAGITTIAWGGNTTLGNYERLRFSVAAAEHNPMTTGSAVFCGTERSYERMKALTVGGTDVRRLFGLGQGDLSGYDKRVMMDRTYALNQSLGNTQVFYAIMGRYRMYKRRGLTLRTSTEGSTLMRSNLMLMVVTARYGGQLERGACAAVTTTAPA